MPVAYILVFAVILFMLWTTYSQQRRAKKSAQELQRMLKKGDEVLTVGGVFGTIRKIGDDFVILEVESGARLRLLRRAIREIVSEEEDDYTDEELDDEEAEYEEVDEEDDYIDEDDDGEYDDADEESDEVGSDDEAVDIDAPSAPTAPTAPGKDGR